MSVCYTFAIPAKNSPGMLIVKQTDINLRVINNPDYLC